MSAPAAVRTLSARMLFVVDDRVLLASPRGQEWFYLPGGAVRPGETVEAALHRELREDTGLIARTLDFVGCVEHAYAGYDVTRYEMDIVFAARLRYGDDFASRDDQVDINSVAIRDLDTFEFSPPALGELIVTWLATHRPSWTGIPTD